MNLNPELARGCLKRRAVYGTEGYWFESSRVYLRQSTTQGGRMRPDRLFYWLTPPLTLAHPIPPSRQDASESDLKRPLSGSNVEQEFLDGLPLRCRSRPEWMHWNARDR